MQALWLNKQTGNPRQMNRTRIQDTNSKKGQATVTQNNDQHPTTEALCWRQANKVTGGRG